MATTTTAPPRQKFRPRDNVSIGPGGPWTPLAPLGVSRHYRACDNARGWQAWQSHLSQRTRRPRRRTVDRASLLWCLAPQLASPLAELIKLLDGPRRATARWSAALAAETDLWIAECDVAGRDIHLALRAIAWAGALPMLAGRLDEQHWWNLVESLTALAEEAQASPDELTRQLLAGELRLTLAAALPEIAACLSLVGRGAEVVSRGIALVADAQGVPYAHGLSMLGQRLACWTRSLAISRSLPRAPWSPETVGRLDSVLRHSLQLATRDGRPVLADGPQHRWPPQMLAAAVALIGRSGARRVARLLQSPPRHDDHRQRLPAASFESEDAGLAVMRCDWQRAAPQMTVAYHGGSARTELCCGRNRLWSGEWGLAVSHDGQPLRPVGDWEQVCWEANNEVDYLELELRLTADAVVQRHMLLGRREKFLLLADAVMAGCDGTLNYHGTLPLAPTAALRCAGETREGTISLDGQRQARVVPLALPEWRCAAAGGELLGRDGSLELRQTAAGRNLFAALFVDLDRRRLNQPLTWRQLTVAADRLVVPTDIAVGYRVRIGKLQWLVYRSLGECGIRTVLGKNLMHQFFVGRFKPAGGTDTLLEIQT